MAAETDPALLAAFAERLVALRKRTGFPQPKSGKPRTVPLTLRLAEALRAASKLGGDWVYPAARSAGPMGLRRFYARSLALSRARQIGRLRACDSVRIPCTGADLAHGAGAQSRTEPGRFSRDFASLDRAKVRPYSTRGAPPPKRSPQPSLGRAAGLEDQAWLRDRPPSLYS
jgi:hypothetical protein